MVVIGDATFVSDAYFEKYGEGNEYDFFASCVEWVRERPGNIGIEEKERKLYVLNPSTSFWPFVLLPALVICLGVIGSGVGVWAARRR
jgi:hypothetical protein